MTTFTNIMEARNMISPYVYETPVIKSNAIREKTKHDEVVLKLENLQRTGSYHLRGTMYSVIRRKEEDLGINNFIAHSTGNVGEALSAAATSFQSEARAVIPKDTKDLILRSIKHYGGNYYKCEPTLEAREATVAKLMKEFNGKKGGTTNRAVVIHPYNDEHLITGYATLGTELMVQTSCSLDCVVVPVGGGSLLSGVAIAVKSMAPNVAVFAAEPAHAKDKYLAFKRGELIGDGERAAHNVSDGLCSPLAPRTKAYVDKYVDGVVHVELQDIQDAFRYVFERCKQVVDLNAATAVAAVMSRPKELERYRRVGIVVSGGNIDVATVPKLSGAKL